MGERGMRIVAGSWRGRALVAPKGSDTRPTADRVREAVFSTLENRFDVVAGAVVLDLFAGSGALAFEALSRGATQATLVERARPALEALSRNIEALGAVQARIVRGDAARFQPSAGAPPFTLLFADPPYRIESSQVVGVLARLAEAGAVAPGAIVVYEHRVGADPVWPTGFSPCGQRRYGDTAVSYAVHGEEPVS